MSVLFHRRPNYFHMPVGPINAKDCARYLERAKNSERAIPEGLSFENILDNRTLPPFSLNDFMDYLVYVEFSAENMQFYLWFKDYVRRFEALPEKEKALSPEFLPEINVPDLTKDGGKGERKETRREASNALMETRYDGKSLVLNTSTSQGSAQDLRTAHNHMESELRESPSVTSGSTAVPSDAEVVAQAGLKWQPCSHYPTHERDQINRVMRHYLAFTAPRELNISHRDRARCLHALQHTTHPSALEPAVKIAEATLRGQSHPNFIRWSICNGNKPRVFFVRTMGVTNTIFGFAIARIFAAIEWFMGISTMVTAYKGLCVILHHSHARNLRPWEQELDSEIGEMRRNSSGSTEDRIVQLASRPNDREDELRGEGDGSSYRPSTMQTFGPKNSFDDAVWVEKYQRKLLIRKVFDKITWTQDETLRVLQDKIVLVANMWGVVITIPLTVIFVALPKGNFF
ncbi:regulator of G protein-like protein [Cadophora sp. MPI-SDFR-AT-0126]|nr:regulator of G protein-like protein [Leotiomycetes sp. MPI-SDFR-AT-0126]